jgi:hypothetical protein
MYIYHVYGLRCMDYIYLSGNPTQHRAFTTKFITNPENNENKGVFKVVQVVHLTPSLLCCPLFLYCVICFYLEASNGMSIPILRSHNRNMFLIWYGFPHLNKSNVTLPSSAVLCLYDYCCALLGINQLTGHISYYSSKVFDLILLLISHDRASLFRMENKAPSEDRASIVLNLMRPFMRRVAANSVAMGGKVGARGVDGKVSSKDSNQGDFMCFLPMQ